MLLTALTAECGRDHTKYPILLGNQCEIPFSEHTCSDYHARQLNDFFMNKIFKICEIINSKPAVIDVMKVEIEC